ncbi:MAG TPA: RnfABCDGE type electron transport complex subunit G [Clostridia bacterium]|nr:RnfABCDGE type electron transport complex subunit G [Clostridia bacterium]
MSDVIKIGLKLFLITLISSICLGLTNLVTREPIRIQHINAANEARQGALPQAKEFNQVTINDELARLGAAEIIEINAGNSGNQLVGYTFKILTKGFGGDIEIVVGINTEDKVESIQIGNHEETPGLGAKMTTDSFTEQYQNKMTDTPITVSKTSAKDQEIQAITGATMTSDSVSNGVNLAAKYYREMLIEGGGVQ